jgi:hypothetical protein
VNTNVTYNRRALISIFGLLSLCFQTPEAQYSAVREGDVVRLTDKRADVAVSIVPNIGAVVFEMKVHGDNIIFFAPASLDAFRQTPSNTGIPFQGTLGESSGRTGVLRQRQAFSFQHGARERYGRASHSRIPELCSTGNRRVKVGREIRVADYETRRLPQSLMDGTVPFCAHRGRSRID